MGISRISMHHLNDRDVQSQSCIKVYNLAEEIMEAVIAEIKVSHYLK